MKSNFKKHLISANSRIAEALKQLNQLSKDAIIFVVDEEEKLIGSLTDGDVRRGLLRGISIEQPVTSIIQGHPKYIRKDSANIHEIIKLRKENYRVIPVLDKSGKMISVVNFRESRSYLPIDVVIMAGGRGERLRPLTDTLPKPLLKVGDTPIIEHNIKRLASFGVDHFWISLNYLGNKIEEYLNEKKGGGINIRYVWEDQPLGTIGSISKIETFQHSYVLVTNSDLLTNLDYEHFFLEFLRHDADMGVVTIPYTVNVPYAVLETTNGQIITFKEKPSYTYYSNGGIYLFKKDILKLLPFNTYYNATDLMQKLITAGKKVYSYPLSGYWIDIGSHEDYSKAQQDIQNIVF